MKGILPMAKILCGLLMVVALVPLAEAQETASSKVTVGTKLSPPFAIRTADGQWSGIAIDLWREIAKRLNRDYEFRETDLEGLLEGITSGEFDVGVAALTVTPERERRFDFSHSFFISGLGIAVLEKGKKSWFSAIRQLISPAFLQTIALLAFILFVAGTLVWFFERKQNPQQFGGEGNPVRGIGAGFWWSAVTMTTVGYGDKAPVTLGGRLVGLIWMFTAIIMISSFTAAITSAVTVNQLETGIQGPEDLTKALSGTLRGSTSEEYLSDHHLRYRTYNSLEEGMVALQKGEVDAFVYDAPILHYLVNQARLKSLRVLPRTFEEQQYAIALREGSPLRELVNRQLLEIINSPEWQKTLQKYLG